MEFKAYILDVIANTIYPASITIKDGMFSEVTPIVVTDDTELDFDGLVLPGLIDAHIHIESSMLTPAQFAKIAVRYGVTSAVCDPHEIANVLGIEGVEFMIENASQVPFNFYFTAPSCVPATPFETSGCSLGVSEIEYLLQKDEIIGLGEMMNFPGVINGDEEVLKKLDLARKYKKPIDGHAPLLSGENLDKYLEHDILTDHECVSFLEAFEKKRKGMKIMVREGSSAKNMEDIFNFKDSIYDLEFGGLEEIPPAVLENNIYSLMFDFIVSDDKNSVDLAQGYLNESIKKAVDLGIGVLKAIDMTTVNPAYFYKLNSGVIVENAQADFIVIDELDTFKVLKTYIAGECVFDGENVLFDVPEVEAENSMNVGLKTPQDFDINYDGDECEVNVIKCFDGQLLTEKETATLKTKNGVIQSDILQDILKISVVERHGKNHVSNGFIKGFGLKKGAIASSIAHDSQNIVVIGYNSKDMADAVNRVIENKGGLAVESEDFDDSLSLPIAGLMTNEDAFEVASKLKHLQKMAYALGCEINEPFMTMAFMSLLVIPSIKLSDKGLFDVDSFEFMNVIIK